MKIKYKNLLAFDGAGACAECEREIVRGDGEDRSVAVTASDSVRAAAECPNTSETQSERVIHFMEIEIFTQITLIMMICLPLMIITCFRRLRDI